MASRNRFILWARDVVWLNVVAVALLVVALCVAGIACCALTQRWMRRHDAPLAHPRARTP